MVDSYIFFDNCKITNNEELNFLYKRAEASLKKSKKGKLEVCFYLKKIQNEFNSHKDNVSLDITYGKIGGHTSSYSFSSFCRSFFGFAKNTLYHYIAVYDKFLDFDNVSKEQRERWEKFDVSKLVELLSVPMEQLEEDYLDKYSYTSTKLELRNYAKIGAAGGTSSVDNSDVTYERSKLAKKEEREQKFLSFNVDDEHAEGYYQDFSKKQLMAIIDLFEKAYNSEKAKQLGAKQKMIIVN